MLYHKDVQRCCTTMWDVGTAQHNAEERVGDFEDCDRWVSWPASGHRHSTTTLLLSTTLCQTLYYFLQLCILPLATLLALLLYSLPLYYCHLAFVHLYYDHWSTIFFFTPASTYTGYNQHPLVSVHCSMQSKMKKRSRAARWQNYRV